ncbi:MAG: AbrB/MazE/SpoVT family DNA-binding domain-containing protein [Candidatus Thermoplasmatota archaeon]
MEAYISKVTTAGQITIPKEIRRILGLDKDSYVEFERIGDTIVLKKLKAEEDILKNIRKKIKKSGITRKRLAEIIEDASGKVWKETYA